MQTPADLDNLLLWLGKDTRTGAREYVEVHRKLTGLFALRGCEAPEALADATLDRAARAIQAPGFTFQGSPITYLRGVARNVYLESIRRSRPVSQDTLPEIADRDSHPFGEVEQLYQCLDHCLARLPSDRRALLLRYYAGEKSAKIDGRTRLAQEEGISQNNLRIQIFRLRKVVRRCVEVCSKTRNRTGVMNTYT